jgi:hypothetical protein
MKQISLLICLAVCLGLSAFAHAAGVSQNLAIQVTINQSPTAVSFSPSGPVTSATLRLRESLSRQFRSQLTMASHLQEPLRLTRRADRE